MADSLRGQVGPVPVSEENRQLVLSAQRILQGWSPWAPRGSQEPDRLDPGQTWCAEALQRPCGPGSPGLWHWLWQSPAALGQEPAAQSAPVERAPSSHRASLPCPRPMLVPLGLWQEPPRCQPSTVGQGQPGLTHGCWNWPLIACPASQSPVICYICTPSQEGEVDAWQKENEG